MKTIIIPEASYDVPNWVFWLYNHPMILVGFLFVVAIIIFLLIQRWILGIRRCP